MYAKYNEQGKIEALLYGNINFLSKGSLYLTVPGNCILSNESIVDANQRLENVQWSRYGSYQITESTEDEAFELEAL
jgi:hypothetical protein